MNVFCVVSKLLVDLKSVIIKFVKKNILNTNKMDIISTKLSGPSGKGACWL